MSKTLSPTWIRHYRRRRKDASQCTQFVDKHGCFVVSTAVPAACVGCVVSRCLKVVSRQEDTQLDPRHMNTHFLPESLPAIEITASTSVGGGQEQRIRQALGITGGPLPEVQTEWLRKYYHYLRDRLRVPFEAQYAQDAVGQSSKISTITVIGLVDPDQHGRHEEAGLLCRARRGAEEIEVPLVDVELAETSPNSQWIEDYWYWFWNWRFDPRI